MSLAPDDFSSQRRAEMKARGAQQPIEFHPGRAGGSSQASSSSQQSPFRPASAGKRARDDSGEQSPPRQAKRGRFEAEGAGAAGQDEGAENDEEEQKKPAAPRGPPLKRWNIPGPAGKIAEIARHMGLSSMRDASEAPFAKGSRALLQKQLADTSAPSKLVIPQEPDK